MLAVLESGEYFGESGVLAFFKEGNKAKEQFCVVAGTNVEMLVLQRKHFHIIDMQVKIQQDRSREMEECIKEEVTADVGARPCFGDARIGLKGYILCTSPTGHRRRKCRVGACLFSL